MTDPPVEGTTEADTGPDLEAVDRLDRTSVEDGNGGFGSLQARPRRL